MAKGPREQPRSLKILLDECVPVGLQAKLAGHSCTSVVRFGYLPGREKESLLQFANGIFDVFITIGAISDKFEKAIRTNRRVAVIALSAKSNRLEDLEPLLGKVAGALAVASPGQIIRISDNIGNR